MNQGAVGSGPARPRPGEAIVFREQNYEGDRQRIRASTPSLGADFSAASIQIGPRTGVTIFSEENYGGECQELTTDLAGFTDSRLKDQKPKSLMVWSTLGRRFSGCWAIEVADSLYLSAGPGGVLGTRSTVSESESFRIREIAGERGRVSLTACALVPETGSPPAESPQHLTIDDLQNVSLLNEPEAGPGKFSLMSQGNRWISFDPDTTRFLTTNVEKDKTIFCLSIGIAADESQLGELRQGEVVLYENRAYWGKAWLFRTDCASFGNVAGLDERISSIRLGPQTGLTVYREAQFNAGSPQAAKQDVTFSLPSLEHEQVKEDQISSMGLWRVVSPESAGLSFSCCLGQDFRGEGAAFEEYTAYRTTLRLPSVVKNVDIWTTDAADIIVDTTLYHVSEDQPVSLPPNPARCLVITSDAGVSPRVRNRKGSLTAPGLKIRTDTMRPHERVVIYPDQPVHDRLANLDNTEDTGTADDKKKDTLWNATCVKYENGKRVEIPVIKDGSDPQRRTDIANAQQMITKVMSTLKYSRGAWGGMERTISAEALQGKAWVLNFLTYRVTAETLYVREGPDPKSRRVGYLRKNDVVEVLGFNVGAGWTRLRRLSDGLTGWSSSTYLSQIQERPSQGEQYRVRATAMHVRKGPGVEFGSLGYLKHDEIVTAVGVNDKGTWRKIVCKDGRIGWGSARYLVLVEPPEAAHPPAPFALPVQEAAPLLRQPPAMSELVPQVSFREASQQEIRALLARVETPEPAAAQRLWGIEDWFSDAGEAIGDAFESVGSFFVTAFEDTVAFFIDLGERVLKFIADTADKIIAAVEAIIDKIKAGIEEVIKWLRIIFDWEDILDTRDYLRDSITAILDYIANELEARAKGPVEKFLREREADLLAVFDRAIDELGGSPDGSSVKAHSSEGEGRDVLDWVLSKVIGGVGQVFNLGGSLFDLDDSGGSEAQTRLTRYWDGILIETAGALALSPDDIAGAIVGIKDHPDDPRQVVAGLLLVFRNQLERLLKKGEEIVLGLFDLVIDLVKWIKRILSADLRIPFISDLIEWVGKLLGQDWSVTLGFSILDVATLILAIPVTVFSKTSLGRAPFKTPNAEAFMEEWSITSGVAGFMNGMVSIPLDAAPEVPTGSALGPFGSVLETMSFIYAFGNAVATWAPQAIGPAVKDSSIAPSGEGRDELWWSLLVYDLFILLADIGSFVYGFAKTGQVERLKRNNKVTMVFASVLGGVHVGLLIAKDVKNEKDAGTIVTDSLTTLPEICSALRLFTNPYLSVAFGAVDAIAAGASLYQGLNPAD